MKALIFVVVESLLLFRVRSMGYPAIHPGAGTSSQVFVPYVVPHPLAFGGEIVSVVGVHTNDERCSFHDLDAVLFQLCDFLRVVGEKIHLTDRQRLKHLRCDGVIPCICGVAQHQVGVQGVSTCVLEMIGLDFGVKADASPFLAQIEQCTPSFLNDGVQCRMQLRTAITSGA